MTTHSPNPESDGDLGRLPEFRKKRQPETLLKIFLKSFGILFLAVVLIFFIRFFFGTIAVETPSRSQLWTQVKGGTESVRLQALEEWTRRLGEEACFPSQEESRFLFLLISQDRPQESQFLMQQRLGVLILGARPYFAEHRNWILRQLLEQKNLENVEWAQAFFWSLGQFLLVENLIPSSESITDLSSKLMNVIDFYARSRNPDLRKLSAFFISAILTQSSDRFLTLDFEGITREDLISRLEVLMLDSDKNVTANSIIGLLNVAHPKARELAAGLIEEAFLISATGLERGGKEETVLTVEKAAYFEELFKAAMRSQDETLRKKIESLVKSHPNVKLVGAARRALNTLK